MIAVQFEQGLELMLVVAGKAELMASVLVLKVQDEQQVVEQERLVVFAMTDDKSSDNNIPSSHHQRRHHTYREKRKIDTFHSRRCEIVQCVRHDERCRYKTGGQFTCWMVSFA